MGKRGIAVRVGEGDPGERAVKTLRRDISAAIRDKLAEYPDVNLQDWGGVVNEARTGVLMYRSLTELVRIAAHLEIQVKGPTQLASENKL